MSDTVRPAAVRTAYYPNMDLLRYVLAYMVVYEHTLTLCQWDWVHCLTPFYYVGGFFCISGFLMYPSFEKRPHLWQYLRNRAIRILPPYFTIVLACALGLVAVSSLSVSQYFSSPGFWKYLVANMAFLNWLAPALPGVFDGPEFFTDAVNGSLWTMKVEWVFYFSIPFYFMIFRRLRMRPAVLASIIIVVSMCFSVWAAYMLDATGKNIYEILGRQFMGTISYFYLGVIAYLYRDFIARHGLLFIILGVLIVYFPLMYTDYLHRITSPIGISMVVLGISLYPRSLVRMPIEDNFSYSIYLFHIPVIQLVVWSGLVAHQIPAFIVIMLSVTLLAFLSNRLIEQKAYNFFK
ncbi:MAG: acyltransferase [Muribaculaceae bacterium]|nr:acyltransferase [Muribaculaceae bacterium]